MKIGDREMDTSSKMPTSQETRNISDQSANICDRKELAVFNDRKHGTTVRKMRPPGLADLHVTIGIRLVLFPTPQTCASSDRIKLQWNFCQRSSPLRMPTSLPIRAHRSTCLHESMARDQIDGRIVQPGQLLSPLHSTPIGWFITGSAMSSALRIRKLDRRAHMVC